MSKTTYFAPALSAYRTLIVDQVTEAEAGYGFGEIGEWYYIWHGRSEVGGYASAVEAESAGLTWGRGEYGELRAADGTENAYAAVRVVDSWGI